MDHKKCHGNGVDHEKCHKNGVDHENRSLWIARNACMWTVQCTAVAGSHLHAWAILAWVAPASLHAWATWTWAMLCIGMCIGLQALHVCKPHFVLRASLYACTCSILGLSHGFYSSRSNRCAFLNNFYLDLTFGLHLTLMACNYHPISWKKMFANYGWANLRVEPGYSILSLSYAVFTLT